VRGHFRPEFLNRLDEIILFHRLGQAHMGPIVDIQVARVQKLLKDRKIMLDLTEGARAWLDYGFGVLGLPEIVAFTAAINQPSRRVMEKLGMTRNPADDFDHPSVAEHSPLRRHVLYRLRR